MASAALLSRFALGLSAASIIGAAALAQTTPPPAPAAPAAAPAYPPTATITTPGYPAAGPADHKLRAVGLPSGKKIHLLPATLETTQWGWFDNAQAPVLRVNSGDTIALETMMHSHNQVVPGATIEQIKKMRTDFPGRGPHTLTGPIYIEEAQPGDVLKVTLNKIVPRAYATNFNVPGMFGQFPNVYQDGQVKYLYLDLDKMQTEFLPGIVLPLQAVPRHARRRAQGAGPLFSVPPGEYAGNMDIRDFVAGTSLYVPVHVPGALLWTGDSHAGQGNGEVNLTAIETAYRELNITVEVIKGKPLDFPRIETPKSWITMGFDQDLNKAWAQTKAQTVKFLVEQRKVAAEQAEKLMASVSDCRVSQVVNVKKGIHCLNPKNARDKEDMERPTKETAKYLRLARQGRRPEQGDERRLDGHDQVARDREEDRPARCLWARQRGDGLPRRRGLRHREERPLPDAEEHLGERQALTRTAEGRFTWPFPAAAHIVLRVALDRGVRSRWRRPAFAQERIPVVTTTTDLRSLTEAVGGDRVAVVSLVPPNMDAEEYQPKPQDVLRLKGARMRRARRARLRSVGRSPAAQAGKPEIRRGGPGYVDASFGDRGAGTARHERRPRRRPRPWQRQPALLARSEECRGHHRARSWKRWRGSIRPMRRPTRRTALRSSRACKPSSPNGKQSSRRSGQCRSSPITTAGPISRAASVSTSSASSR